MAGYDDFLASFSSDSIATPHEKITGSHPSPHLHRLSVAGYDDFLASFDLVKKMAEMGFGFCQRNGAHTPLRLVIMLVI